MKRFWGGAGHVFAVFPYETDTCFCMCNAETRAYTGLKSGGNSGDGIFWAGTNEKRGEGDVFVCVVSLLSCFFAVVFIQLVWDPVCVKTKACAGLKIVEKSSLLL